MKIEGRARNIDQIRIQEFFLGGGAGRVIYGHQISRDACTLYSHTLGDVVVYHVNIVAIGHRPMIIGCVLRTAGSFII